MGTLVDVLMGAFVGPSRDKIDEEPLDWSLRPLLLLFPRPPPPLPLQWVLLLILIFFFGKKKKELKNLKVRLNALSFKQSRQINVQHKVLSMLQSIHILK